MRPSPVLAFLLTTLSAGADLADLPHPRLLWPAADEAAVRARIADDPLAARLSQAAIDEARAVLDRRTCRYDIPDGKRLLGESRLALHNVIHCAWAWRITGEEAFRERTIRELDAACALKDWNPKHFLDVGEMALAVAIGYDWLHGSLTPDQRKRCEDAIIGKALEPAREVYRGGGWWARASNNWSQVCGTGIALAAAAIAERDPGFCNDLFRRGVKLIGECTRFYEPDGAYPEGPGYWHYGSNYHVLLLAACGALGAEVEVPRIWQRSGEFMLHVVGPTGIPFNFADAGAGRSSPTPAQCWIASRFRDPVQAAYLRHHLAQADSSGDRLFPLHVLWLPAEPAAARDPRLAARFAGTQPLAMFRTSWRPDATYLAIKGGTATASHGQMDVGSFVYDAAGQRWIHDLGSDNYNMPGYFGSQRWDYFRLTNRSHNTLVIGDALQKASRTPAGILTGGTADDRSAVVLDLTPAYQGQAEQVHRRATFDTATGAVTIEDRVRKPVGPVRWAIVTRAEARVEGAAVVLEQDGRRLVLERRDQCGGSWTVGDAKPPTAIENPNRGFRVVSFTAPAADELRLEVGWNPPRRGARGQ